MKTEARKLLTELGEAIRNDWSDLDGRTTRRQIGIILNIEDGVGGYAPEMALKVGRERIGVCPAGGGHWESHCEGCADDG